jgi:transmembrane sensor
MTEITEETGLPLDTPAEWFARMQGQPSHDDELAFTAWLAGSPERRDAYRALETGWTELGLVAQDETVLRLRAETLNRISGRAPPRRLPGRAMGAVAATVVLVALTGFGWWKHTAPIIHRTEAGERLTVTLTDGSQVDLAPRSRLKVRITDDERRVELDQGQAYFVVAHDATPFRVYAGDRTVTALGTQFQVSREGKAASVVLVEGSVRVAPTASAAGRSVVLKPGQGVSGPMPMAQPRTVDREVETAWRSGRLVFRDRPLSEVVASFNRLSAAPLEIGDPIVAGRRVSGSFRYDGVDQFSRALEVGFGVKVRATPDGRRVITDAAA